MKREIILSVLAFLAPISTLGQTVRFEVGPLNPLSEAEAGTKGLPIDSTIDPQSSESRIGPEDLLRVAVFEAPEMNCATRVSADGEITLALLGSVKVAGMTARDIERALEELLRRSYMKDPHVTVFVQELESHPVTVVGAVKKPGIFQLRESKTLIEMLSLAEGLADDAGDSALIMRGAEFGAAATPSTGQWTQPDHAAMHFAPTGVVVRPGSSSALEPGRGIEQINLKKLLESSDSALNVVIRPGDIVKVPRAGIVYVVGEVRKPGGFALQRNQNISVLQALALAEGPTHTSAMGRARIIRTNSVTHQRDEIPINLARVLSGKSPDQMMQPDDIVFVPNSAAKSVFYRGSETALQTAAGVAIYRW